MAIDQNCSAPLSRAIDEFVFVLWLHVHPIRDMTEITDIEQAMVGRAVIAAHRRGPYRA